MQRSGFQRVDAIAASSSGLYATIRPGSIPQEAQGAIPVRVSF